MHILCTFTAVTEGNVASHAVQTDNTTAIAIAICHLIYTFL